MPVLATTLFFQNINDRFFPKFQLHPKLRRRHTLPNLNCTVFAGQCVPIVGDLKKSGGLGKT